jgi:hypothetical protein
MTMTATTRSAPTRPRRHGSQRTPSHRQQRQTTLISDLPQRLPSNDPHQDPSRDVSNTSRCRDTTSRCRDNTSRRHQSVQPAVTPSPGMQQGSRSAPTAAARDPPCEPTRTSLTISSSDGSQGLDVLRDELAIASISSVAESTSSHEQGISSPTPVPLGLQSTLHSSLYPLFSFEFLSPIRNAPIPTESLPD